MKKIAILTSGGDSSSMNKCLSSFATYSKKFNYEIYFVYEGFKGLVENKIVKGDYLETKTWYNLPGTKINSARFVNFKDQKYVDIAVKNLKQHNIDCLIVIGGDGSYMGGLKLFKSNFNVICLPGTIDNDVASTKYTIGFDTSLNTIVTAINQIKSCMTSHKNVALIEIMGRNCSDLTVYSGLATEADIVITYENILTPEELLKNIKTVSETNKNGIIILISENILGKNGVPSHNDYKKYIEENSNFELKINILGHLQRGGTPTAMDLVRTTMMTYKACECINYNEYGKIIAINDNEQIIAIDIEKGINDYKNTSKIDWIKKYI